MKAALYASVATLLTLTLSPAQNATLDSALGRYRTALATLAEEKSKQEETLKTKYTAALRRMKSDLDPSAEIDALLAVAAEIESLSSEEPVKAGKPGDKLLAVRSTYQEGLVKIQSAADAKHVASAESTISGLRKLTGSLAASDELDAALAAERERRGIEADQEYLAAKERIASALASGGSSDAGDLKMVIPRHGLLAYFPFDGRLDDTKGNTIPLNLNGDRRFASSPYGRALHLENVYGGTKTWIEFPLPGAGESDFSISFCMRADMSAHSKKALVSIGKDGRVDPFNFYFQQRGGDAAELQYNPPGDGHDSIGVRAPRPEPMWQHVALTFGEGVVSYYLDGKLQATLKPRATTYTLRGMQAHIAMRRTWHHDSNGKKVVYEDRGPNMLLDELAIYGRKLSKGEVRNLAKNYRLFDNGR